MSKRARHTLGVCLALFVYSFALPASAQDDDIIPSTLLLEQIESIEQSLQDPNLTQTDLAQFRAQTENLRDEATACVESVEARIEQLTPQLELLEDLGPNTTSALFDRFIELNQESDAASARLLDCQTVLQKAADVLPAISQRTEDLSSQYLWQRDDSIVSMLRNAPKALSSWPSRVRGSFQPALRADLTTLQLLWILVGAGLVSIVAGVLIRRRYHQWYDGAGHDKNTPTLGVLLVKPFATHAPMLLLGLSLSLVLAICILNFSVSLPMVRVATAMLLYGIGCVIVDWTTGPLSPSAKLAGFYPDHVGPMRLRLRVLLIAVILSFVVLGTQWFGAEQTAARDALARFLTLGIVCGALGWVLTYLTNIRGLRRYRIVYVAGLLTLGTALITAAAGFLNFASYLTQGSVRTAMAIILVWLALWFVFSIFEALVDENRSNTRSLRNFISISDKESRTSFGVIQLTADIIIWLAFVVYLIYVWDSSGVRLEELQEKVSNGFSIGNVKLVPLRIVQGLAVFGAFLALNGWVKRLIDKRWLRHMAMDRGARDAMVTLSGYIGFVVGILVALRVAGIDLGGLALIGGGLALGIGFGLQAIASNFVSGLILLFERPIKAGDFVTVGEVEGFVRRIRIRATDIETLDNQNVLVPNSELVSGRVTNWVLRDPNGRLRIRVGVAYGSNTDLVRDILEQVGRDHEDVISDGQAPAPRALFMGFGDSSLDFELRVRIRRIEKRFSVISDINFRIDQLFREHGIEIPFPQRDLHLISTPESQPIQPPAQPIEPPRQTFDTRVPDDVTREIKREIDFGCSIESLWKAVTDADQLKRWFARDIEIAARIGGRLQATLPDDSEVDANIDIFMPPRRLRWASLTPDGEGPLASGPIYESLMLSQKDKRVLLSVEVSGIPADEDWEGYFRRKEAHWEQSLAELKKLLRNAKKVT
ncbi:MAG: mechanosensitive ion channel domain-containing protein [Pseudomonadota bacterium]